VVSYQIPTNLDIMIAQLTTTLETSLSPKPYKIEGMIQVFTSTHRNFYTDVMVQALRIAGHGTPVLVVQFLKGGIKQGPDQPIKLGQNLEWLRCNLPRCVYNSALEVEETEALKTLWEHTQKVVLEGHYSLVILEELSLAINYGLIPETEVISLIQKRPSYVDLILTGPEMPESILDIADQITQVRRNYHDQLTINN
jgi:cob(I)alamin adenosyltransferase